MRAKCVLGFALVLSIGLCVAVPADEKADPREELATAVPEAIRLLENMEYEAFVTSFTSPDELKHITDRKHLTPKQLAEKFQKTHAPLLLKILQKIEGKKPELDKDGKMAWFLHGVKEAPSDTIVFEKVGKCWHILNESPPRPAEQRNAADSR